MDIDWNGIIKFIGVSGLSLGALTFMSKALLKQLLEKDKERFTADLKIDLEKHKSKLEKERIKLQVAYSNIYAKQAEIIVEIYEIITLVRDAAVKTLGDEEGSLTHLEFKDHLNNLTSMYRRKKILLPDNVCNLLDELIRNFLNKVDIDKFHTKELRESSMPFESEKIVVDLLFRNKFELFNVLPKIQSSLEQEFKSILLTNSGIEE
ncbi:hypothetical protein [Pseudoalteromonas rhizosphaerae]|uniref:hypothetical protein n=1 Tax=Pseudoalteromonas rhizosphaerae TaxID=2518973 RepID=UPI00384AE319